MQYYQFHGTELSVSQLCFGCWGITSDFHWGDRYETDSIAAMKTAIECGVNFFDTAPMYGDGASETMVGKFLHDNGLRDEIVIASKIRPGKMRAADVIQECDESLSRLKTDYIDLYQTHWTDPDVPLAETWQAMLDLKRQGKVRHLGVCNAGLNDLSSVGDIEKPLSDQLPYNLISRMIEFEILPQCDADGIGVLVYSPLMHGMLSGKFHAAEQVPDSRARTRHFSSQRPHTRHQESGCEAATFDAINAIVRLADETGKSLPELSLQWLLSHHGIASLIAGAKNESQARQNANFVSDTLDEDIVAKLDQITSPVKQALGANADLWDGGEASRYN
ncbi:aldo/keto reductase [Rhodopirellula sp. MGV]|uniref:aldo/keto reductase n=1 Tax=Rhodopirellula sp. MGV TaxID=2023130 RepID=UPI000B97AD23|nr:aldo/keto reductase [Rhodopirellula sp. MGV]OYP33882.1 hypothetical protein CGZ80_16965 [Rhodopirellula sp. MGV]PNY37303.1 aldo/keto reductase [Rhodopirellula baltica]